uniref:Protein BYPASS-related n=1 Tax=Rhizophora mucronata TaxID=61149 RepID=A0A2P2ISL0_RHIMU
MPSTDNQRSSSPIRSLGHSIFSLRREQVHSMEASHEFSALQPHLEPFQKQIADRFHELSGVSVDDLLSIGWLRKLLDAFVCCQEEFRVLLMENKAQLLKPSSYHSVDEYFERSLKALDICNATRDGIEKIRSWNKHLEIVLCALDSHQKTLSEGQFHRARKALMDLALAMLDEKDCGSAFSHRNRSFGQHGTSRDRHHAPGHSRSLSWSVSRSWSAAKQLQSFATSLVPPRGNEIAATNGFAIPVFTMSSILLFVLWTLVAAIPCQDRGLGIHFSIPRHFSWGPPLITLYERIMEESKKRDRRNSNGLLKEIYQMEKCARHMTDLIDLPQFLSTNEQKIEVEQGVQELALVCEAFKNGLDPLERQVREVFHRIMNCRAEGLEVLGHLNSPG